MRALLVVNPRATGMTARAQHVVVSALGEQLKVDVAVTEYRGHGQELAAQAAQDELDLVIGLGGDGTVNELVNGLLREGPSPALPALAVLPAGNTNVFARQLGLPNDPVEATGVVLEAVRAGRGRRIGLGRMDDRWFTFNAGLGLDAEVVQRVEKVRASGRGASTPLYVRSAVNEFMLHTDRRHPGLIVSAPDLLEPTPVHLALICNTSPWTYLGQYPINPCPDANFSSGLDLFGLRSLGTLRTLNHFRQMLGTSGRPHGRAVVALHDQPAITVVSSEARTVQVDGDSLPPQLTATFTSVPSALRVIC